MGSSENFCLRWNDFEANVSGSFRELRAEADFFDVTLACNESASSSSAAPSASKTLQAHKVILSASSPFFKSMLRNVVGHPNPLIYLRGIKFSDLEHVLDFVYHGEVNVAQDDLNSFLAVAEDLQIKGLTQSKDSASTSTGIGAAGVAGGPGKKFVRRSGVGSSPAAKRARTLAGDDTTKEAKAETAELAPTTHADVDDLEAAATSYEAAAEYVAYETGGNDESTAIIDTIEGHDASKAVGDSATVTDLNDLVVGLLTFENGTHTCNLCGKKSPWRTTMLRHIEANHVETAGHVCDLCGQVCKTRHAFGMHKKRKHGVNMANQPLPVRSNSQQQPIVVTSATSPQQIVVPQQVSVSTATIVDGVVVQQK